MNLSSFISIRIISIYYKVYYLMRLMIALANKTAEQVSFELTLKTYHLSRLRHPFSGYLFISRIIIQFHCRKKSRNSTALSPYVTRIIYF